MHRYEKSTYVYSKQRKHFGRQTLFQQVPAHMIDSIYPDKNEPKQYILRNPVHREVQATTPQSEHETNTKKLVVHDQGINHTEGGWPRDVHLYNEEHVQRHRRRVMHDENYIHTVMNLAPAINHYVDQNNAIDMYQTYFAEIPQQPAVEKYSIRVANTFRDTLNRPISCITWTNEKKSKLAVAYCHKTYKTSTYSNTINTCFLWDIRQQNEPADMLQPKYPCWQLACSPVDPDILVAGLENGTCSLFDVRAQKHAVSSTSPYNSHRDPVTALLYMHTRTNNEFFTGSSDGQCMWWDARNLSKPTDQLPMSIKLSSSEVPNVGNAEGVSSLQFDKNLPTKFLCGTESGYVINVNRMGRERSEVLASYWNAHTGPVRAVQRSPCTLRMFLTCGDWSVRVWSEEVRSAPIIVTSPYRHEVNDVTWAPLRYSSYMAVAGGFFYYWDLLRKRHEAIATLKVSDHSLLKICAHSNGKSVAVGDSNGSVFLLTLEECMIMPGDKDKLLVHQTYERETKREHILDTRVKEIRMKARVEEAATVVMPEITDEDELDRAAEEDYWKIVKEEHRQMEELLAPKMSISFP